MGAFNPEVRAATAADVEIAVSILEEVAAWTWIRGLEAWQPGTFGERDGCGQRRLRHDVTNNSLYLVWLGSAAVATFSLRTSDERYWPDASDGALYLHRFAVRRAASGMGSLAIRWMVEEAQRRERSYLRLDCLADNPGIRRYYERAGFTHCGETTDEGTRLSLYEMRVGEQNHLT
jgi:GNAT superfamily N-acetyltransferase